MMLHQLEVREPPELTWVSLTAALTWIEFHHSLELEQLLEKLDDGDQVQEHPVRLRLQDAWRRMADAASVGRMEIRGRVVRERAERALDRDELRNNRFLAWVLQSDNSFDVLIERHEDTYDGGWERPDDPRGSDFHHVVVRRDELLAYVPVPSIQLRRRRKSGTQAERGAEWLRAQFQSRDPKSVKKEEFIAALRAEYGVSARQALEIWKRVAPAHPAWSAPGRPRKSVRAKSNHKESVQPISTK